MDSINKFISELSKFQSSGTVFNMYHTKTDSVEIRRNNLRLYLQKNEGLSSFGFIAG